MKTILKSVVVAAIALFVVSCNNDDSSPKETVLEIKKVSNLYAPQSGGQGQPVTGDFVKFSFATGEVVTSGDNWDIAFRGTSIIVNGGYAASGEPVKNGNASIATVTGVFAEISTVPADNAFKQDAEAAYAIPTGSGNGWYSYNPSNHVIAPIAGKVFVVKTHEGKYAKMEILNYYQDAPANPTGMEPSKYYTFNYVYQANGSGNF